MNTFNQHLREQRRLTILRLLAGVPSRSASSATLYSALPAMGVASSRDDVATDLAWLRDQDLVRFEQFDEAVIASLTGRGDDVAAGRAIVPGVARPEP